MDDLAQFFAKALGNLFNWTELEEQQYVDIHAFDHIIDEDYQIIVNYTGPTDKQYTYSQIENLTSEEIHQFANILGFIPVEDDDLNKERILRILILLGLINYPELISRGTISTICQNLSVHDINNFRIANRLDSVDCQIDVDDPDGLILKVSTLNNKTYRWINQIENVGSIKLIKMMVDDSSYDDLSNYFQWASQNPKFLEFKHSTKTPPSVLEKKIGSFICKNLNVRLANKYRISKNIESIPCTIRINDYFIKGFKELNKITYSWYLEYVSPLGSLFWLGSIFEDLIKNGDLESFKIFMSMVIEKDGKIQEEIIPLASRYGKIDILIWAIDNYQYKSVDIRLNEKTGLYMAAKRGYLEICKILVSKGADIYSNNNGLIPMHGAAIGTKETGHMDVVDYFLELGVPIDYQVMPNGQYEGKKSALYLAAKGGHLNMCKFLVERGANPYLENKPKHRIPMFEAALNGHYEVVRYFLRWGIDVNYQNSKGRTLIIYSVNSIDILDDPLLESLENEDLPFEELPFEESPFLYEVIDMGADVNHVDKKLVTPIFYFYHTNPKDVITLVNEGADINFVGPGGTVLTDVIISEWFWMVKNLMALGADPTILNPDGTTALELALASGDPRYIDLMSKYRNNSFKRLIDRTKLKWTIHQ